MTSLILNKIPHPSVQNKTDIFIERMSGVYSESHCKEYLYGEKMYGENESNYGYGDRDDPEL